MLVLSGDLDANAPSTAGRQAAAQFAHATFVEIPNAGHTPGAYSACALDLALRFIATFEVSPGACARDVMPPPVNGRAPVRVAQLPLVQAEGATRPERRALALVLATAGDLLEQAGVLEFWGTAKGLRGGRYVVQADGAIRLVTVKIVRDARVSGVLTVSADGGLVGTLRLAGPGVADGRLQVRLAADGSGRATGVLDGRTLDVTFRP